MKSKEPIKIYWAPVEEDQQEHPRWNILYTDPTNVLAGASSKKNRSVGTDSYLFCPSYKDVVQNMFSLNAPIRSEYIYVESPAPGEKPELVFSGKGGLNGEIVRGPTLEGHLLMRASMRWIFFAEEPITMELTPPFLDKTENSQYGAIVPGRFDIGQWFRGINLEFQLWEGVNELKIEKGEPMAYVRFMTDRPVELVRFDMTNKLTKIADSCVQAPSTFGLFGSLQERYNIFNASKTNRLTLKHIKENLL
jgi:hypothetical protein